MNNDPKRAALAALRLALRPVFRLLLRSGVTWQDASDTCKATLVEVATSEFGLHGRPTNMSRVAIMTGLGRREVKRLRDLLAAAPPIEPGRLHGATRVLTGWYLDADFTDEAGLPLDLPFESGRAEAGGPSFTELCRRYGGDLAPVTMRRELVRVGALEELPGGELRVVKRYYMPLQMDPDAMVRAGSMLEDLGTTVSFNLGKPDGEPSRFAGRATNTRIRPADARRFRAYLEQEGQAFLERVDEWLSRHEAPPAEGAARTRNLRVGVGVYGIHDERKP
ncbi:MAG: hypothetical protein JNK40_05385 [Chromatiales bacterium]|nr:hypothetical protein [Chromatiales bacterium]